MYKMEQKKSMRSRAAAAVAGVAMVAALGLGSASAASATPVSSSSASQANFAAGPINVHTAKKGKNFQWWNPTCYNITGGASGWRQPSYCWYN
jgi:hypothetical protein